MILEDSLYLHGLNLLPQFGPTRLALLAKRFGSFKDAYLADEKTLAGAGIDAEGKYKSSGSFTRVIGGATKPHRTSHLNGKLPAGGNMVMADQHVEWRKWNQMRVRTTGSPEFWW